MSRDDPPWPRAPSENCGSRAARGQAGSGLSRRSLLRRGAAGVAAASLGAAASTTPSAGSPDEGGPSAPENLRVDWRADGEFGVRWDSDRVGCDALLSHFHVTHVTPEEGEGTVREVPPERDGVALDDLGATLHDVRVRAVDALGRSSDAVELAVDTRDDGPQLLARPFIEPTIPVGDEFPVPIGLPYLPQDYGELLGLRLEVAVRPSCAASIESFDLGPLDLDVESSTVADDGSSATLVASGELAEADVDRELVAIATVSGERAGAATLDVVDASLRFTFADATELVPGPGRTGTNDDSSTSDSPTANGVTSDSSTANGATSDSPTANGTSVSTATVENATTADATTLERATAGDATTTANGSTGAGDAEVGEQSGQSEPSVQLEPPDELDLVGTWTALEVERSGGPAPPENVRVDWQSSSSGAVRWNWPGGLCSEALSHFEAVAYDGEQRRTVTVPAERAAFDAHFGETGSPYLVEVRAVDQQGRRSEPAFEEFRQGIADPGYSVSPTASPTVDAGETASVPLEFSFGIAQEEPVFEQTIEVAVVAPCVATVEGVSPASDDWTVTDRELADDGTSIQFTVRGPPHTAGMRTPAEVEVAGVDVGETLLHVRSASVRTLVRENPLGADGDRWEDYQLVLETPERLPSDVDVRPEDFVAGSEGAGGYEATVTVEDGAPPAPENLRVDWHVSQTVGLRWDWPGDPCAASDGAHFRVTVDGSDETVEETVPLGAPGFATGPHRRERAQVEVVAVDADGRESEPVRTELQPAIADPQHTLTPAASPTLETDESAVVPVELSEFVGGRDALVRYELTASLSTPCVATIEDVTLPADASAEVVEATVSDDGRTARIVAEGPPPERLYEHEVARIHVVGDSGGETLLEVEDESLVFLRDEYSYADYEQFRTAPEQFPEDVAREDVVLEGDAATGWSRLLVLDGPPAIVGDAVATDPDDDRLYEDVDGDGRVGHADVQAFFSVQHRPEAKRPAYFDFNGNDAVGHGDVVSLFEEVASQSLSGR